MPIKLDIVPKRNEDGTSMENGEPKRVKKLRPDRFGMPKQTDFAQDPQKVKQRQAAYHQNLAITRTWQWIHERYFKLTSTVQSMRMSLKR